MAAADSGRRGRVLQHCSASQVDCSEKVSEVEVEGPSLVILQEELEQFRGQKVLKVTGNTKQPKESLTHRTL